MYQRALTLYCLLCILATGDAVYMDNEQSLEEYVLCQDGIIFHGSYKYPMPMAWNFGQVPTPTPVSPLPAHILLSSRRALCQSRAISTLVPITGACPFIK